MTDKNKPSRSSITIPERICAEQEIEYSRTPQPDFGPLARDRIPVRGMVAGDLRRIVDIDKRITGRDRRDYFDRKLEEALHESDVRVSLVAERDGDPVGFVMARVDFGEFGHVQPTAVLDTIGVDPVARGQGVGRALLSQLFMNLMTLRVESVRTELGWSDQELVTFMERCGVRPSQRLCLELATK